MTSEVCDHSLHRSSTGDSAAIGVSRHSNGAYSTETSVHIKVEDPEGLKV